MDVETFARQLVGAHIILAKILKNPMLEISQKEAESLAVALREILAQYKINIAPGTLAWLQFFGVCVAIYAPRIAITFAAMKAQREAKANTFENGVNPV